MNDYGSVERNEQQATHERKLRFAAEDKAKAGRFSTANVLFLLLLALAVGGILGRAWFAPKTAPTVLMETAEGPPTPVQLVMPVPAVPAPAIAPISIESKEEALRKKWKQDNPGVEKKTCVEGVSYIRLQGEPTSIMHPKPCQ